MFPCIRASTFKETQPFIHVTGLVLIGVTGFYPSMHWEEPGLVVSKDKPLQIYGQYGKLSLS